MDRANRPAELLDGNFADALAVLEDAEDGFAACDSAFRIVFLNSAAERLCGKAKAEVLGTVPWESSCGLVEGELERESRRVMAERVPAALDRVLDRVYPRNHSNCPAKVRRTAKSTAS